MDLITTHSNADFDALSSLVAAKKLYPNSRLVLPGSEEKAVRSFLALIRDRVGIEDEKTCRMDDVRRLIIVDNRHLSRIGAASKLLQKKGITVHIYDHHPRSGSDIKADKDVYKEAGATVSIILEILSKKGDMDFTPLEATLMLLGIYEETGSLSYASTTKLDVEMVAKLLEKGANLNAVALYLNRELSGVELEILIDLIGSVETVNVNGIDVAFARAEAESFDGEMGAVVHKLQDVESFPVLFAFFERGAKMKVLARSRLKQVDVNKVLAHFSGGGHPTAAGARVEGLMFKQVRDEIVSLIRKNVKAELLAKDIMTTPVKTVFEDEKVTEVEERLLKYGVKGAPVLDVRGELVGIATTDDIKKALKSGMGHSRIKGYMSTAIVTINEEMPLHEVRDILIKHDKGRLPVVKDGKITGIITRTDVLKGLHGALFPSVEKVRPSGIHDISGRMEKVLPGKLLRFIKEIGREADKAARPVFLVGGFVRDIILKKKNFDLDIVVEGDAIGFGKTLADRYGASLVTHSKFGTATVVFDWPKWLGPPLHPERKLKIDIASARKEVYERPAALPVVEFSSLKDDLYRRDFTINAMAACINEKKFGFFIDFFGGISDLEKGVIRALHEKSFIDDPTRIFRAVRFEQRFGFEIEENTRYLIEHAISREMFHRTENQRIRDEIILMLREKHPEKAVLRMKELHELRFIHPELELRRDVCGTFNKLRKMESWFRKNFPLEDLQTFWVSNLLIMIDSLSLSAAEEVCRKFVFTRLVTDNVRLFKEFSPHALSDLARGAALPASGIYWLLEKFQPGLLLCLMAKTNSAIALKRIKDYIKKYRFVKLSIKGEDLVRTGIEPGPKYSEILRQLLSDKIDGKLPAKKDELRKMTELLSGQGGERT